MPLESTVICLDTSAWMINGDYLPNRLAAQQDAAGLLITLKLEANVESTVGLLAHGGPRVRVLMPPTDSEAGLHACLDGMKAKGPANIVQGVKIAQLALKHRRNKNGGARIIIFVGSPINVKKGALKKLGIGLRRSNIALDVIGLGEHEANRELIQTLVDAANDDNNCSYAPIPEGVPPSDALMTSSIVTGASGGAGGAGAGAFAQYGGVNPELDPELAMTLAASLEQMRQTTEARDEASKTAEDSGDASKTAASAPAAADSATDKDESSAAAPAPAPAPAAAYDDDDDDDAELRMAMALSLADAMNDAPMEATTGGDDETPATPAATASADDTGAAPAAAAAAGGDGEGEEYSEDFVMSMLSDLPGVDQNDPAIQAMLAHMRGDDEEGGDGEGGDDAGGDDAGDAN